MKIDIFTHILPEKYLSGVLKKAPGLENSRAVNNRPAKDLQIRFKVMIYIP